MLDAHPNVVIPHESQVILNLFRKYGRITIWRQKDIKRFVKDLEDQQIYGIWNLDKKQLEASLLACKGHYRFHDLIKILYIHFISIYPKSDIQIIGDKNPVYSYNFGQIFKIFPEARFIHLTRDYRDQILSMRKMDFEIHHPALVSFRWKLSVKMIQPYKKKFPENFFSVRYEDLVADPETTLKELCDFLSIEFDPGIIEFYKKKATDDFLPEYAMKKYHASLFNPVSSEKVDTWKQKLSVREIKMADAVVGKSAEIVGHQRIYTRPDWGVLILVLPFLVYGHIWNIWRQIMNLLPLKLKLMLSKASPYLPMAYHKLSVKKVKMNKTN
jgi:hypothetical protein